jgi:hypothetical protein
MIKLNKIIQHVKKVIDSIVAYKRKEEDFYEAQLESGIEKAIIELSEPETKAL